MTIIDKSKMRDPATGNMITQSLFLEKGYNTDQAVFTCKPYDYEYKGVIYPSLKRLYLEKEDPVEYEFASEFLLGWKHWQRICANKLFTDEIEEWRVELEVKLRGRAVAAIAREVGSDSRSAMQAAKWMAEKGWEKKGRGRPSKQDMTHEREVQKRIEDDYKADVVRLRPE